MPFVNGVRIENTQHHIQGSRLSTEAEGVFGFILHAMYKADTVIESRLFGIMLVICESL